jgi:hypothetical protein
MSVEIVPNAGGEIKLEQIKKNKGVKGFVAKTTDPNGQD